MATATLNIQADEKFLNEVQEYFDGKGIDLKEVVLTYISWYMSVDTDEVLPRLHNLEADNITSELADEWKEFQKLPEGELVSYTADGSSI